MNNSMSKPELASIFNLEFYRKQKNWRFVREVLSEHTPEPECSHSAKALLNKTYDVQAPAELPVPSALDEAFIDSVNRTDQSLDDGGDFLTDSEPATNNNWADCPSLGPPLEPPDRLRPSFELPVSSDLQRLSLGPPLEPPDRNRPSFDLPQSPECHRPSRCPPLEPLDRRRPSLVPPLEPLDRHCLNSTFTELGFAKTCPTPLHQYPDRMTDYPPCDIGCDQSLGKPYYEEGLDPRTPPGLYARALRDYFDSTGIAPPAVDQRHWQCPNDGWPSQSAVWTNTARSKLLPLMCDDAADDDLTEFRQEEQLLREAHEWLEQRQWQRQQQEQEQEKCERQARRERMLGTPPVQCELDCLDGIGYADENLLMDKLSVRPRDRLLACAGGGSDPLPSCPPSPLERSLDSERFMLGAHAAPHSSEIELFAGETIEGGEGPLSALVWRHAQALRHLLHLADARLKSNMSSQGEPAASRSAHDLASFEEFPTRDVGPTLPAWAQPASPALGRGRGRRMEPPVVCVSAGRPYRP